MENANGLFKKQGFFFYFINVSVVLVSGLLALFGLRGSIQQRLLELLGGSFLAVKLLLKTAAFFVFGYIASFLLLGFLKVVPQKSNLAQGKTKRHFLVWGWIFYFIAFSLLVLKRWGLDRFPLDQPEVVYFTLLNIRGGG